AQCISGDRHEASIGRPLNAEYRCHTDETQPPDHRDLDRPVALRPHQQRCNAAFDEVDVLDGMVVVLKDRPALERNGLQEGTKPFKERRGKTGEQAILDPNRLLAADTAQRTFQRYPMEVSLRCVPIGPCSAATGLLLRHATPSSIQSHWNHDIPRRPAK